MPAAPARQRWWTNCGVRSESGPGEPLLDVQAAIMSPPKRCGTWLDGSMIRFALAFLATVLGACPSPQRPEPPIANAQPARPAPPPPAFDDRDVIVKTVLERFIAAPNSMP